MLYRFKKSASLFTSYATQWYVRFERPVATISLISGFVFNAVALTRVDEFKENFWIAIHLFIAASCIVLINREDNHEDDALAFGANPQKIHFWLVNILQFAFGGLLSTFFVFYFRSAELSVAWPFLLILFVACIANEFLKRHYARLYFQISFLFFSFLLFSIFLIPVLVKDVNQVVFFVSGVVSLIAIFIFLGILRYTSGRRLSQNRRALFGLIGGIFVAVNGLYFGGLIPPLPLSLRDVGVYHHISRTTLGDYIVVTEKEPSQNRFESLWKIRPTYHNIGNKPVYVFSSIFSPADFDFNIVHQWEKYDEVSKKWVLSGTITLPVTGGRSDGYRTYSAKSGVTSGAWRVTIQTTSRQVLGRIVFDVVTQGTSPVLVSKLK